MLIKSNQINLYQFIQFLHLKFNFLYIAFNNKYFNAKNNFKLVNYIKLDNPKPIYLAP